MLLLALPLAVAVWAFGAVAGKRERSNADTRLVHAVNTVGDRYQAVATPAQANAERIAGIPRVQAAFRGRDRRALRRLQRIYASEGVLLLLGTTPPVAALGRADVKVRGNLVGHVLVGPLDQALARRLAVGKPPDRVGFVFDHRLVTGAGATAIRSRPEFKKPSNLASYRVVAVKVSDHPVAGLVTLEPRSNISAAATRARWIMALVGLGVIAALLLIAYAVAPAIARSRLSRQQRDQAERVLAHLGDGVIVVDSDGVVQLWNRAAEAIIGLRAADEIGRAHV